ncbi:MAG: transposase, partial [Candidatus Sericytochromatia bacterium]
ARKEVLPTSGLAKAVTYLLNHEQGLRVFLDDPAVPIDNNESGRAVRPTVLGRVNYLGSRSERGTEVQAILSMLAESAKRCGSSTRSARRRVNRSEKPSTTSYAVIPLAAIGQRGSCRSPQDGHGKRVFCCSCSST